MLQDNTNTDILYKKPKPHGQSRTETNRSAHQIRMRLRSLRSEMVMLVEGPEPHKLELRSSHLLIEIRMPTDYIRTSFFAKGSSTECTQK